MRDFKDRREWYYKHDCICHSSLNKSMCQLFISSTIFLKTFKAYSRYHNVLSTNASSRTFTEKDAHMFKVCTFIHLPVHPAVPYRSHNALSHQRKATETGPLRFHNSPVVFKGSFRSGLALWVCGHVVSGVRFTQPFLFLAAPGLLEKPVALVCLCLPVFHVNG